MKTLELFAGIAGITHGMRGFVEPVAFVEINKDAQEFLTWKFPEGKVFGDVTTFSKEDFDEPIDMITAGFPCTGFSMAGVRNGFEHAESGLFSEVVRITKDYLPKFVFLENSSMLSHKYNLDVVIQTMDSIGYNCKWVTLRATAVGALHCRYRWFCLCTRKDYTPETLISDQDVHKFDWDNGRPPIQVDTGTYENSRLARFAGYSVVPDQIRYAFTGLYTGDFNTSFSPSLVPGNIEGKVCTREDKIINGWFADGTYYEFARKETHRGPVNIVVTPREIPEKHNGKVLLTSPVTKKYWCTPCANHGKASAGGRVLTDRLSHSLPTQASFSPEGKSGKHLSGKFSAWLMGYDSDYLGYLTEYN
jgi:DNA-cytosine methyltransferase